MHCISQFIEQLRKSFELRRLNRFGILSAECADQTKKPATCMFHTETFTGLKREHGESHKYRAPTLRMPELRL